VSAKEAVCRHQTGEFTPECPAIKVARKPNSVDVIETLADLLPLVAGKGSRRRAALV
jgi:hypothetical protein